MSPNFHTSLAKLERLSPSKLDKTSRRIRGAMADAKWKMGLCLLALKRSGSFRKLGFGTLSAYAERVLQLSGRKVGALLGAAEALEHLPLMSEAFRAGRVCWSKVRVMHGLATPETEAEWLDFARAHTSVEVERKGALSPLKWKRHRAMKASLAGKPSVSSEEVNELLFSSESVACGSSEGEAKTRGLLQVDRLAPTEETTRVENERVVAGATAELQSEAAREKQESTVSDVTDDRPAPPSPPRTIRVVFELTPDQYALYEQAESRVRAQDGRRLPRAEVLKRMAESVLSQGTARSRARHQVLVHTVEGSDEAWYETERGVLPVASEVLEEALEGQEVLVMGSDLDHTRDRAADPNACPSMTHTSDSRPRRTSIPNATIRGVFARAGHRCECCGRKGGRLDVHHRDPVSEGGGNDLGRLELLCRACHTKNHQPDFEEKLHWRVAREQALKSSLGGPPNDRPVTALTERGSQRSRLP